jgi:hypothetical protein
MLFVLNNAWRKMEIKLNLEVYCSCGEGLCQQTEACMAMRNAYIIVKPCKKCIEKALQKYVEENEE